MRMMKHWVSDMRYVEPMGMRTWVIEVGKIEEIPCWITWFGEDNEFTYYLTDYTDGPMWAVRKEK